MDKNYIKIEKYFLERLSNLDFADRDKLISSFKILWIEDKHYQKHIVYSGAMSKKIGVSDEYRETIREIIRKLRYI